MVAHEEGLFEQNGVPVSLNPQPGWASVREKLVSGELDAAQCLAGLALSLHHGLAGPAQRMVVPIILNANGNAVTLSNQFSPDLFRKPGRFKEFVSSTARPLILATVHRYSFHNILLHDWLTREGLRPGHEAEIVYFPPAIIPRNLANGGIDGCCVGEPWNSGSILNGKGWCAATSCDLANGHPEKVLAASEVAHQLRPEEFEAFTVALLQACRLCDNPDYRPELCHLLSRREYLDVPVDILRNSLTPGFDTGNGVRQLPEFHRFFGDAVNAPTEDKVNWLLNGLRQAGHLEGVRLRAPTEPFRPDLYRQALASLPPRINRPKTGPSSANFEASPCMPI